MARLAARQHGLASLSQLNRCGLSPSAIRSRVEAGRLHRIHRGVFAVGHPLLTVEGRWMAAVLACGPGAVLSHRSAAALWGLRPAERARIDVAAPGRRGRGLDGIDAHRRNGLAPCDTTESSGIPCTTPSRTLLDLAIVVDHAGLLRAIDRAERLRLFNRRELERAAQRAVGHAGIRALRTALAECTDDPSQIRSELEERFLALCETAGIARPRVNAIVEVEGEPIEVDFLWPDAWPVVEADGHRFHATRRAFESDRRRDQRLTLSGWRVMRCTWRQVTREPDGLAGTIRGLLSSEG
jgi:predicted transcriptional regulator of viral defense system